MLKTLERVKSITANEIKPGDKIELRDNKQRRMQVNAVDSEVSISGNYLTYVYVKPARGNVIALGPSDLVYLLG